MQNNEDPSWNSVFSRPKLGYPQVEEHGNGRKSLVPRRHQDGSRAFEAKLDETSGTFCVDSPTWADACLIPQLYSARRFELDVDQWPKIAAIERATLSLEAPTK